MAYYDLTEAERITMTERAIAERRTLNERWNALEDAESEPWNTRAAAAAEWLSGETGLLDLGCGTMVLERHLAPHIAYWPSDVAARDDRTIVCDLNREPPPRLPASAVACLGVLEYLLDPLDVMRRLGQSYRTAVVSYCTTDSPAPLAPRRAHAWVNDYDRASIEKLFGDAGWAIDAFAQHSEIQALWRLTGNGPA